MQAGRIEGGVKNYQLIWSSLTIISSHHIDFPVALCWIQDTRTNQFLGLVLLIFYKDLSQSGKATDK